MQAPSEILVHSYEMPAYSGGFIIRSARRSEAKQIRRLIYAARLNPMSLNWQRFLVATIGDKQVIGCGQVKEHYDGSRELASIVVKPEHWRRGIARVIIRKLLELHQPPLFLTCRASLGGFYQQFGFRPVQPHELPLYFRWIKKLFVIVRSLLQTEDLLVMVWEDDQLC